MPLVSVITPMYNAAPYIISAYRSLLEQSFSDFEWLVSDDCSTDGGADLLEQAAKGDERVKIERLAQNVGPVGARNAALRRAKGRYVAYLDADDLWLPEKLAKQIEHMRRTSAPLSYTAYRKINQNGALRSQNKIRVPAMVSFTGLLRTCHICASSAMFDRELTGNILEDESVPAPKNDYHMWLSILSRFPYAYGLNEDLVRLRVFSESLTGNKVYAAKEQWKYYRRVWRFSVFKSLFFFGNYAVNGLLRYLK